jgi:hypothetical protein
VLGAALAIRTFGAASPTAVDASLIAVQSSVLAGASLQEGAKQPTLGSRSTVNGIPQWMRSFCRGKPLGRNAKGMLCSKTALLAFQPGRMPPAAQRHTCVQLQETRRDDALSFKTPVEARSDVITKFAPGRPALKLVFS